VYWFPSFLVVFPRSVASPVRLFRHALVFRTKKASQSLRRAQSIDSSESFPYDMGVQSCPCFPFLYGCAAVFPFSDARAPIGG